MTSDVLIIGGGVIGLAIARELRARGVNDIAIVDRGQLGGEASWAAAGMLSPNIEAGAPGAFHRFCSESLDLYPEFADGLLAETGVDIELDRTGTLCVAFTDSENDRLQQHGTPASEVLSGDDVRRLEPWISPGVRGGLAFPNDWQVDNRKLVAALRRSAEANRVAIKEFTEVAGLVTDGTRITGAKTRDGVISAGRTVLATGAWTSLIKAGGGRIPFTVKPIRGQMASFETAERKIGHVIFSPRGYLVPRRDGRLLIGATVEDVGFDNSTIDDDIALLRQAAIEIMPSLADTPVADRWSGLRPFVEDGLPVIGRLPGFENIVVATAHYRNGILLAPRTAQIVVDKIAAGADSEYFDAFGASRFTSPKNAAARN